MPSVRVMTLAALAAASLAVPAYFAAAQPGDPKPDLAPTPSKQPADSPKPSGEGRALGRDGDQSALPQSVRQSMMIMNRGLRTLKNQAADPAKKDDNLKLVSDMERGCLAAKALSPDKVLEKAPDQAKKDELSASYRRQLIAMMTKLLKLETAIMDGKGDDADKLIDEIGALRDESHGMLGTRGR